MQVKASYEAGLVICSRSARTRMEYGVENEKYKYSLSSTVTRKGCPSGKSGGDLGEFSPGQMVKEFDQVVFNDEVGKVHGPIKTDFGYHLIEITNRTE